MSQLRVLLSLIACAMILSGCSSTFGTQFDEKQISKIEKGKTTQGDIQRLFGEPSGKGRNADGETQWTYSYKHASSVAGFGSSIQQKVLFITFSYDGIVKDFTYQESEQ